jgi:hypothetical protein
MRRGRGARGTAGKVPALLKVGATAAGATHGERRYVCGAIYRVVRVGFDNSLLREGALRVHNDGCDGTNSSH